MLTNEDARAIHRAAEEGDLAAARLLREWAGDARNVVVLTARPGASCAVTSSSFWRVERTAVSRALFEEAQAAALQHHKFMHLPELGLDDTALGVLDLEVLAQAAAVRAAAHQILRLSPHEAADAG